METTQTGEKSGRRERQWWQAPGLRLGLIALLIVIAAAIPFGVTGYPIRILTGIFMYAALASSLNIIAGYTGYIDFGNAVFLGLGAYTTGILSTHYSVPLPLGMLAGAALASLYALLLGLPILRLRGHYFAIATIGVMEATRELIINAEGLTGGGTGLTLPITTMDPRSFNSLIYYVMLALFLVYVLLSALIRRSRFGYGLRAIRADEEAAEVSGINTTRFKVLAWMTSAAMTGLVGGVYAYWYSYIQPGDVFNSLVTVKYLIMTLIGGAGTVLGPVVGAFLLELISETVWSRFLEWHLMVLGGIIVLVVIFMPRGIVPMLRRGFSIKSWWAEIRQNRI